MQRYKCYVSLDGRIVGFHKKLETADAKALKLMRRYPKAYIVVHLI